MDLVRKSDESLILIDQLSFGRLVQHIQDPIIMWPSNCHPYTKIITLIKHTRSVFPREPFLVHLVDIGKLVRIQLDPFLLILKGAESESETSLSSDFLFPNTDCKDTSPESSNLLANCNSFCKFWLVNRDSHTWGTEGLFTWTTQLLSLF